MGVRIKIGQVKLSNCMIYAREQYW